MPNGSSDHRTVGEVEVADGAGEEARQHTPVMPEEVLRILRPQGGGIFLDATIGGAGHAIRLLEAGSAVRVIGIDQDEEAMEAAGRRLAPLAERVTLMRANFRELGRAEFDEPLDGVTGALFDLGISSRQLDAEVRGFSFRPGTPLDMRMDAAGRGSAADFLNGADEEEMGRVFRDGEERRWRALSREVVRRRKIRPFRLSDDLVAALTAVLGRPAREREKARLFQAVRIAVNDELAALGEALEAVRVRLAPGGRMVVLSYHSLEDRVVKRTFRKWATSCVCPPELPECRCRGVALGRVLTRRPLRPDEAEVVRNSRARSARLRAWEKGAADA